jgi:hypothetical protein
MANGRKQKAQNSGNTRNRSQRARTVPFENGEKKKPIQQDSGYRFEDRDLRVEETIFQGKKILSDSKKKADSTNCLTATYFANRVVDEAAVMQKIPKRCRGDLRTKSNEQKIGHRKNSNFTHSIEHSHETAI